MDLHQLHERYRKRAQWVRQGRNRIVYGLPNHLVVKLPTNPAGIADNLHEAKRRNTGRELANPDKCEQYPRTWLIDCVLPVLYMEQVEVCRGDEWSLPLWVDWTDNSQVGYTRRGRLVIYDYGLN